MRRLLAISASLLVLTLAMGASPASSDPRLLAKLDDEQREVFSNWKQARGSFDRQHDAYWAAVNARRNERRRQINAGERVTSDSFVMQHPPK